MATGGVHVKVLVSGEVTGSETVFENACNPCGEEENKEAAGFCVDCGEWLCDECFRIHTRPKPSRHHVLKSLGELKTSGQSVKIADKCTEKCDTHYGKKLKYFCLVHDSIGCSMCIFESHRSCDVKQISDISSTIGDNEEYTQLTTRLVDVAAASKEIVTVVENKRELVSNNQEEIQQSFRKHKEELIVALNEVEITLEEKCNKTNKIEASRFDSIVQACELIENESMQIKRQLEQLEGSGQYCNTFVAMKRTFNKLQEMEVGVKGARDSSGISLYTFRPNQTVLEQLGQGGMGTLVQKRHIYSDVKTKHLADICVKTKENAICLITASALLPPDKLIVTDNYNCQVKVIDTTQNKMLTDMKVDGKPWSICKATQNTVVVTLYDTRKIVFIRLDASGKLLVETELAVNGQCRGVAATHDRLIVSYISPDKLEIIDMDGNVTRTLATNSKERRLFRGPQYVALSPDHELIYVSDVKKSSVVCMKMDGSVVSTYQDDKLRKVEQAAVDGSGVIYVCGHDSSNIHLITEDCKKIKIILGETDGLRDVFAVTHCDKTDRLYIGMKSNVIKVFQLS